MNLVSQIWGCIFAVLLIAPVAQGQSRFEQFYNDIQSRDVTTIDEAIGLLPESMRSSYTLMKESASLQQSTMESPRVILMGYRGEFIVTFNDSGMSGGDIIETAEFDTETNDITFRGIEFVDGEVTATDANPTRCQACHGQDPTYIWSRYSTWDGQYGEFDDEIRSSSDEATALRAFNVSTPSRERYRHLIIQSEDPGVYLYPFYSNSSVRNFHYMPGIRMSKYLSRWNARRLMQVLRDNGRYSEYKKLLAGSLLDCTFTSYLEPNQIDRLENHLGRTSLNEKSIVIGSMQRMELPVMRNWGIQRIMTDEEYREYQDGSFGSHIFVLGGLLRDIDLEELEDLKETLWFSTEDHYSTGSNPLVPEVYWERMDDIIVGAKQQLSGDNKVALCEKLITEGYADLDMD